MHAARQIPFPYIAVIQNFDPIIWNVRCARPDINIIRESEIIRPSFKKLNQQIHFT
jgi:hypothetical protein